MTQYLKAIYAAAIAGFTTTASAYEAGGGHIGLVAGLTIAAAVLTAGLGVAGVTNAPPKTPTA
jgi:hypothetical protein